MWAVSVRKERQRSCLMFVPDALFLVVPLKTLISSPGLTRRFSSSTCANSAKRKLR